MTSTGMTTACQHVSKIGKPITVTARAEADLHITSIWDVEKDDHMADKTVAKSIETTNDADLVAPFDGDIAGDKSELIKYGVLCLHDIFDFIDDINAQFKAADRDPDQIKKRRHMYDNLPRPK